MDDVTFGRDGPYGDAWSAAPQPTTASGVAISGRSLMPCRHCCGEINLR